MAFTLDVGSNEGFRCDLEAYIESRQGIVITTNSNSGVAIIGEIRRDVAVEYAWPDFKPEPKATVALYPETLSAYTGLYQTAVGDVVQVTLSLKGGRLYLQADPFGAERFMKLKGFLRRGCRLFRVNGIHSL